MRVVEPVWEGKAEARRKALVVSEDGSHIDVGQLLFGDSSRLVLVEGRSGLLWVEAEGFLVWLSSGGWKAVVVCVSV